MSIREGLARVLKEYPAAAQAAFTGHPLASYIRHDLRDAVAAASGEEDRLIFKGSAGQGIWAKGPWVAIFNPIVTTGAQRGYYPVYLFREDMAGVYLSLNQGATEAKEHYKSDAKTALRARASNFRALLGGQTDRFPEVTIDVAPASISNETAFYEAGNVCAAYYPASAIPAEERLVNDLKAMLSLYEALITGETGSDSALADDEDDAPPGLDYEDATRFRLHKRIERRAALAKKVKQLKGCTCQVCGTNFAKTYGALGDGYIEAHHLKPIASLKGQGWPWTRLAISRCSVPTVIAWFTVRG
jgi:5-methylcytosine-specific restriction enzyme A